MRKHAKLESYVMKNSSKLFGEEFNLKPGTKLNDKYDSTIQSIRNDFENVFASPNYFLQN